jgi:hypothetical protein
MLMVFIHQLYLQCFSKGEDDMNAAGMIVVLTEVSGALGMPHFQSLVTNGSISQGEFEGTRSNLAGVLATLKKTPPDKIEAMVAQYDEQLTEHLDKFNAEWGKDTLSNFKDAQIMAGYVTTIMAKSGLKE